MQVNDETNFVNIRTKTLQILKKCIELQEHSNSINSTKAIALSLCGEWIYVI